MRGQRGESRIGCLIMVAIAILAGYVFAKTIPVYLDKLDYVDQLKRIAAESGARAMDADQVKERVIELTRQKDFEAGKDDIKVNRTAVKAGGEIRIAVKYQRTVDFSGYYQYTFKFETKVSSFVGAL